MIVAWVLIGALVGAGGAVLVQSGPWWASSLVHYAIPYVLLISIAGATSPRPRAAAVRGLACFVTFVAAYYVVVAIQFGAVPFLYAGAWLVAAVTVCPIGSVIVCWAARRRGPLSGFVFATAGAVALSDGSVGNLVRVAAGRLDVSEVQPVTISTAAIGLAGALAIVVGVPRDARTRLWGLGLLVPLAIVATFTGWAMHFGLGPYL